jgi:translation initiation factor 2B subunit (eIF-2B alpha/beta/delta family)
MNKKLILVTSPPACGKTYISKQLAKRLKHVVYLDKDTLITLSKQIFVVAGEIRKMAENSGSYVGEIQNILRSISDKSVNMKKLIDETLTLGNTQEKATKEIEEAVKEISDSTIDLEKVSKIL